MSKGRAEKSGSLVGDDDDSELTLDQHEDLVFASLPSGLENGNAMNREASDRSGNVFWFMLLLYFPIRIGKASVEAFIYLFLRKK